MAEGRSGKVRSVGETFANCVLGVYLILISLAVLYGIGLSRIIWYSLGPSALWFYLGVRLEHSQPACCCCGCWYRAGSMPRS